MMIFTIFIKIEEPALRKFFTEAALSPTRAVEIPNSTENMMIWSILLFEKRTEKSPTVNVFTS
jgi:hypothetical protein